GVLADELFDRLGAFAARTDLVDDAQRFQFLGGVDLAVAHHALGLMHADALTQQAHAAGAWKQTEQYFGKAEFALLFGNDEVRRQRGFKTAAERAALHERNGRRVLAQRARPLVDHVHAQHRIIAQSLVVALADALAEIGE